MKYHSICRKIVFLGLAALFCFSVSAQKQANERARWFVDSRFGMFIHWGVYSGAEGFWKGEKLRYDNDYAEWIYYRNRIAKDEYLTLLDRFDWENIDPEEWVLLAKQAGMKYVTLTAKHHDGFALWDSKVSDYNIAHYTSPRRDIVKELAAACKKHGLKMGLYYSHWIDWEHPDGWDHSKEITGLSPEQYDRYWQGKVIPQMRELLTNYGEISIIWFDMWIHHSSTVVSKSQLMQLKSLIRELQPNCLINSRLGLSIEEDPDIDFKTLGDNELGNRKEEFPWQSPGTVAHSWGFSSYEDQWRSTTTLLQSLINNVSLNGNFMLNIGPRANGDVPYEITQRLQQMGEWLAVNGESVYGSGAFSLNKDQHPWGKITCKTEKDGRTRLYLHVYTWPLNKSLCVTGIAEKAEKIYLLADKQKSPLSFSFNQVVTRITLPNRQPDPFVSVVVMEFGHYPAVHDNLVAETEGGGFSLSPQSPLNAEGNSPIRPAEHFGSVPAHAVVTQKSTYRWRVFIDQPCLMNADVSCNFQAKLPNGLITVRGAGKSVQSVIQPTGRTVGEPRSDWQIDSFNSQRVGVISFSSAGFYNIELEIEPGKNGEVGFQWLWLGR
jgi:alpha-L-fucosidase